MDPDMAKLLLRDLEIFMLTGALLAMALSLMMISRPRLMLRAERVANRWLTMRHVDHVLDTSVGIDQWFYHHHRFTGMLVVLGSAYVLVHFGYLFDKPAAVGALGQYGPASILKGAIDALVACSMMGGTSALSVGLLLWLWPNHLRAIEKQANRWISSRRATKAFSVPHSGVDQYVEHHTRPVGWLLLMGSAILFTTMASLLM